MREISLRRRSLRPPARNSEAIGRNWHQAPLRQSNEIYHRFWDKQRTIRTPSHARSHVNTSSSYAVSPSWFGFEWMCAVWLTRREATGCTFKEFAQIIIAAYPLWHPQRFRRMLLSPRCIIFGEKEKKRPWKGEIRDGRATFVKIGRKSRRVWRQGGVASIGNGNEHTGRITARAFSPIDRTHDRR